MVVLLYGLCMAGGSRVQLGLYGLLIIGCLDGDGGDGLLVGVLVEHWDGLVTR